MDAATAPTSGHSGCGVPEVRDSGRCRLLCSSAIGKQPWAFHVRNQSKIR